MSTLTVAVPVNQPGSVYIEQLRQFPSASGGPVKYKRVARWQLRPGDDSMNKPTFFISPTQRLRIKSEAQFTINIPAGTGQAAGSAQLYDQNMTGINPPVLGINQVAPVARGAPTALTVGGAAVNFNVNPDWQFLEIIGS